MQHHSDNPKFNKQTAEVARRPREIPNMIEQCHSNVSEIRQLLSELESRLEPVTAESPYGEDPIPLVSSTQIGGSLQTLSADQGNVIYRLQRLLSNLEI